jgi:hypothetical protein
MILRQAPFGRPLEVPVDSTDDLSWHFVPFRSTCDCSPKHENMLARKGRRASTARPGATPAPRHLDAARWARVNVFERSSHNGLQTVSYFIHRSAGELGDLDGNTVISMVRVAPPVSVQPVPHVKEFLANYDLERSRLIQVDSAGVNQHGVRPAPREIGIRASDCTTDRTSEPCLELPPVLGKPDSISTKPQATHIDAGQFLDSRTDSFDAHTVP